MSFKYFNLCTIVFVHLMLHLNVVYTVLVCKISVIYWYASRAVCAYTNVFPTLPGCALIGACALIMTNTV